MLLWFPFLWVANTNVIVYYCRSWFLVPSGLDAYEVRNGIESYGVDLGSHICTCNLWDISGIPCVHAQVAILYTNQDPVNFISSWFSKEKYKATYEWNILPVNGSNMWEETKYTRPLPPIERRMPGRPSVKRKRHVSENQDKYSQVSSKGRTVQCKNCLQSGHNKTSCKNPKVVPEPQPKKKMGRPRLEPDLLNWSGTRRGGRGGVRGAGRGGGRGKRGATSEAKANEKATDTGATSEAKGDGLTEDDTVTDDIQGVIKDMRESHYTSEEIMDCLGLTEDEYNQFAGIKEVPVEIDLSVV